MIAFVLSLVLAVQAPADPAPPVLLAPPIADLALFPDDAACNQQIIAWRRHLHWLAICEGLAPRHHRAQYQRWQRQTRDLIGLWETLEEAHARRENWEDDTRRCLLALYRWLGPDAYYAGRMPSCPIEHACEPWCDP